MKLFTAVAIVSTALAGAAPLAQSGKESAEQLAGRIQARYDTIRDFEADFVQTYQGGLLRTKTTEQGTVAIKRPGRMRWIYTKPERKEFVSNGERIYSYIPGDKQVIVSPVPGEDEAGAPVLFLSGKGNILRDFDASFADLPSAPAGTWALKLVPRQREPEYEWLVLVVDRKTLALRMLVTVDSQGGQSTFVFSRLKENVGLSDKPFDFKIPRGVEIVTNQTRR